MPTSRTLSCTRSSVMPPRGDRELPRPILEADHCLGGISDEILDDLLQLNAIAGQERKTIGEHAPDCDPARVELAAGQCECLDNNLIQVHGLGCDRRSREQRAQPIDDFHSPVRRREWCVAPSPRAPSRLGGVGAQHSQAGARIGDDPRQGLVHFMRDRRGRAREGCSQRPAGRAHLTAVRFPVSCSHRSVLDGSMSSSSILLLWRTGTKVASLKLDQALK